MQIQMLGILLLLISSNYGLGQHRITGEVTDNVNAPIFFATVALYNSSDSTFLMATSSDEDGTYVFDKLKTGTYYLKTNMLGYEDELTDIVLNKDEFVRIKLSQDVGLLSTVEITARVPLLEQRADKLIVNVEKNITNTSGSLLDVMKKVPGMIVINDRLSMAGSGTPTILINGKSTQYMDVQSLLRDMPGDNISKVEIIHQPGAEYEAAGSGPIINIILKKNSLFGTNGNISLGIGRGELWDYTTGLNLSHYAGNFNITAGLGLSQNAWVDLIELDRRLSNIGNDIDGTYSQINREEATPITYRGNVRMDWDISKQHRLGLSTKYYNNSNEFVSSNVTNVDVTNPLFENYRLDTENDQDRGWTYTNLNPYYIFEIDTAGRKIETDVNFASYQVESMNTLSTVNSIIQNETEQQRYVQPGDTKIFATSVDYTHPLSDMIEVKTGLKYSLADLDNDLQSSYRFGTGDWKNNALQSNHYLFEERIYAGYGKVKWTSGDWSGTMGLRYEDSRSIGESVTIDSTLTRNISKLFPSFSVSKKLLGGLSTALTYSYRIDRPRYSSLNPFVYYLDPFTYESGNPNLRPELTQSAKFSVSLDGQPFFNIEYKRSNDAIVEVTRQEADSEEASKTDINFDRQSRLSTTLLFPLDFVPGLNGYGGVIVSNNQYNSLYNDGEFDRSRWSTTAFMQLEFNLPGGVNAELGGWYNSGDQEGIFNSEHIYGSSFGVSKKFMNNKARLSLGVEDIFSRFWHAQVDYQQDLDLVVKWQRPVVNARFSYKFGNQHLKKKSNNTGSAREEIQRATSDK